MRVNIFHNVSRDASFGLNTVFRTGTEAPEGVRALPLSDGRYTWKEQAPDPSERHELVWVFHYEASDSDSHNDVLNRAWESFNNGSGREDASYFARRLRSLSVGDVVMIDNKAYSCEGVGWQERRLAELRTVTAAQAEQIIRARYEFGPRETLAVTVPLAD